MAELDRRAHSKSPINEPTWLPEPLPPRPSSATRNDSQGSATGFDRASPQPGPRRHPSFPRRRSSVVSDLSSRSMLDSTENLLLPRPTPGRQQESSHMHSIPLAFAILPAVGGLFFKDGSVFITDVFLLGLGGLFLNWFVRMPWEWYNSAQAITTIKPESSRPDTIYEESEDEAIVSSEGETPEKPKKDYGAAGASKVETQGHDTVARDQAAAELRRHESFALLSCFLGPLLGAYLLHGIRGQLTRPSEGLVSNFNLTIFVLAAELRPCSHLIKLIQARTLHLQRVVEANTSDIDRVQSEQIGDAQQRIEELEALVAERLSAADLKAAQGGSTLEVAQAVRQSVQPQVDALNRAVRRYEKRATTQTIQTEARLQDLEARLRDALSLAAAAANQSQKPGLILATLEGVSGLFMLPFQALWSLFIWPLETGIGVLGTGKTWLLGGRARSGARKRRSREKENGQHKANGHMPLSKNGRH